MGWCPHCNENHPTQRDHDTCMISCCGCGRVLHHDEFTDEPTFVKGAGGESRLAGSYVKSFQSDYSESRRRTLDKGKQKIHELAVSLCIEDPSATNIADAFYQIAVERNFTKGRRTDQVAAACLYIACRDRQKPFLLIDFSISLGINVYVLGAVFLQLCQLLSLQEHPIVQKAIDPSLFIDRYTNELVGENINVSRTALHIIASMKRDWMQTGRKPSGLCGAAVYISALSHGVRCSKLDIVKAVHVCEATLTKRLIEFENTDSGSLTIEEFIKNANVLKKEDHLSKLSDVNSRNSDTMEVLCQHKDQKPHFAGLCKSCCQEFIELSGGLHGGADPPAFQIAERERVAEASPEKVTDSSSVLKPHQHKSSDKHVSEVELEHSTEANQNATEAETANFTESACFSSVEDQATIGDDAGMFQKSNDTDSIADEADRFSDIDDNEVEGYLNNEEECYYKKIIWEEMNKEYLQEQAAKEAAAAAAFKDLSGASGEMRSAHELAAATNAAVAKSREEQAAKEAAAAAAFKDLSGASGEMRSAHELAAATNAAVAKSREEQAAKEAAAAAAFKDLSGASGEMRSAHELAAATNAAVAKSREERRQKKRALENGNPAQTAAEATRQMLTKKGLSSKINYDVLDKLFDEQPIPDTKRTRIESPHARDIDGKQFNDERNEAFTDYDGDEQEEENGDTEEMGGEEPYMDEVGDYNYSDNDGDDEY